MEPAYLNRLPNDIRNLVGEIEEASGVEIIVVVDSERAHGTLAQPCSLACQVNAHGATLLIPAPEHFPDSSVLHELLHLRRFLLSGVPRISVCNDYPSWTLEFEIALTGLDNALEHLIIVPEELQHRGERGVYWRRIMLRVLADLQSPALSKDDRERHALIGWVFIQHVLPDPELMDTAATLIDRLGIQDRAARLVDELIPSLHSKERTVRICFEHLHLPIEAGCLEYIDCLNVSVREVPLAEVRA